MKRMPMISLSVVAAFAVLGANAASLPHVFGDNMVLQRGQRVPVWGTGEPGEAVTVEFAGQSVSATVGDDGRWRVDLAPLEACAEGAEFRVKGANEIVLTNVVVGEVWFCSGQSNMEYTMSARRKVKDWKTPVAKCARTEGAALRVAFDNAEGLKTRDGLAPTEFEIRSLVGAWTPAAAQIDGHDVVLTAEGVDEPRQVRFAAYNGSTPNLVNGFGLPAGPFRMKAPIEVGQPRKSLLHLSHVHRGGGKEERPDNTLETFLWCWENGSALECDCRRTKDGVGIMLHDNTLMRTGRGIDGELAKKNVSEELTWAMIKDVDVGSYLDPRFSNERIPTIEATFAAMKEHPTWLCFVDEKGAGPKYIAEKAVEAGVQDQVYYTGPSHEKIIEWNRILPGGKSLLWLGAWPKNHGPEERARADKWFRDAMAKLREKDFEFISCISIHSYYDPKDPVDPFVPSTPVLKEMVDEFHRHGIPVCSIPFQGGETGEVYLRLWELGCDGFSTDYPSVMFRIIKSLREKNGDF